MIGHYDVVIPVAYKDFSKAHLCLDSLRFLCPQPKTVYVITPSGERPPGKWGQSRVVLLQDDQVLKVDRTSGFFPNWTFQQCMKLTQDVTECPWYLTIDSDVTFLKPFPVMTKEKTPFLWYFSFASFPYFNEMLEEAWGVKKVIDRSMICHMMMFNKGYCAELFGMFLKKHPNGGTLGDRQHFYRWMVENQKEEKRMSEFETYSNFVWKNHPVYTMCRLVGADMIGSGSIE